MLRDKHSRKYAILFTNLNILCKLIRSCHLHTNAAPCVGVVMLSPQQPAPPDGSRAGWRLWELLAQRAEPERRLCEGIAESVAFAESGSTFDAWPLSAF